MLSITLQLIPLNAINCEASPPNAMRFVIIIATCRSMCDDDGIIDLM
jgi:hypothetical protein